MNEKDFYHRGKQKSFYGKSGGRIKDFDFLSLFTVKHIQDINYNKRINTKYIYWSSVPQFYGILHEHSNFPSICEACV